MGGVLALDPGWLTHTHNGESAQESRPPKPGPWLEGWGLMEDRRFQAALQQGPKPRVV